MKCVTAKISVSSRELLEINPAIPGRNRCVLRMWRYLTKIEINIRCVHSANWRAKNAAVRDLACERFEWQAARA